MTQRDNDALPADPSDAGSSGQTSDGAARADALRDLGDENALSADFDVQIDAEDIDVLDLGENVGTLDQAELTDEPYDSLDAEDVGTEWLLRATQNSTPHRRDPGEAFESAFSREEAGDGKAGPSEAGFGSDQEGAPLAPYAGTHEDDVAAELPVGNVDAQGNTELHVPANPPDALRAPPTSELAVSERELAGRNVPPEPGR